jgi:sigma-B regulation protein RsbU (phosphoserine phosphatase)
MKKARILVIDDNPHATRLTKLMIERSARYEARELNDPTQALDVAQEFRPDLILLDVCMPGVEGSELAEKIHGTPFLADVPIVFLTCIVTPSEAGKNGRVVIGHHEYMAKPVRPNQLIACIRDGLERANRFSESGEPVTRS